MNISEALKYAKVNTWFGLGSLQELLSQNGVHLDLSYDIFEKNGGDQAFKQYVIHEWSVDDHCGGLYVYTYMDNLFASMTTEHEDRLNYEIVDQKIYEKVIAFVMKCIEPPDEENFNVDDSILKMDIPILQFFDSTYQVMGKHLLYIDDNQKFHKVEKWWQDREELKKDREEKRPYKDLYEYKFMEIIIDGVQHRVHFRSLVSVLGDNEQLANDLVANHTFNEPQFRVLYCYQRLIDLDKVDDENSGDEDE